MSMHGNRDRRFVAAVLVALSLTGPARAFTVDQVVADIDLPADTGERLRHGEMVRSPAEESSDRELGADLTFLVQQPLPQGIGRGVMTKQLTQIFERSRDSFTRRD